MQAMRLLDAYTDYYHNLSASGATDLAQQFSNENRTARILDQSERHRTSDPTKCGRCKRAAETVLDNDNNQAQSAESVAS